MSSVRSASSVGPNRTAHVDGTTSRRRRSPAARASRRACLITPRSAPSVRLKCVYHWYFVRLVRIACCGFAMTAPILARSNLPLPEITRSRVVHASWSCPATATRRARTSCPPRNNPAIAPGVRAPRRDDAATTEMSKVGTPKKRFVRLDLAAGRLRDSSTPSDAWSCHPCASVRRLLRVRAGSCTRAGRIAFP